MSRKFLVSIDHNKLESLGFTFQNLASNPSTPATGQAYWHTGNNLLNIYTGSAWVQAVSTAGSTMTGVLVTAAGTTSVAGGLKLTSGSLKTSPTAGDAGSIEFTGSALSFIDSSGVRQTLGVSGSGVMTITMNAPASGFTITNSGTSTNPIFDFALNNDLAAVEGLSTTGIIRRTAANTWSAGTAVDLTTEVTGVLPGANGGTGVNNSGKTITLGGNLTTSGAFASTFTMTNTTSVTFPTSGTLLSTAALVTAAQGGTGIGTYTTGDLIQASGTTTLSVLNAVATGNVLISGGVGTVSSWGKVGLTTHVSGILAGTNGGTGVNNGSNTITLGGSLTTSGANNITFTTTGTTSVTLPTSGTILSSVITADLSFASTYKITNLIDPTNPQDAATKNYVDNAVAGLSWKDEVRVATTADGTLASAFANGQTVDGVTLATGDRILLRAQTAGAENGLYIVQASGAPVRSSDADTAAEIRGMAVFVTEGTTNGGKRYVLSNSGTITLGTTALTYVQFDAVTAYVAGNGLTLTGSTFAVNAGNGIIADGTSTRVDTAVVVRKYAATIGDGSTTAITVTHNLGTTDITASVRTASGDAFVDCDITAASTNTATFTFAVAPSSNQYRVVVHG